MAEQESPQPEGQKLYNKDSDSIIQLVTDMLVQRKMPPKDALDESLLQDPAFLKLYEQISDIR